MLGVMSSLVRSCMFFYPYEQAADLEVSDRMVMPDQSTISFVADRVLPDGKKRTVIVTCFRLVPSSGQNFGLGTLIIDI